jgi:uncharacterized protein YcbK (DUF882 family)
MTKNIRYGYYLLGAASFFGGLYLLVRQYNIRRRIEMEEAESGTEIGESTIVGGNYTNPTGATRTTNFKMDDFDCNDGTAVPTEYTGNAIKLMEQLEVLRAELGNKRIRINSGYRTPSHNRSIGGERRSYHLTAKAADIAMSDYTPSQIKNTIERLISEGKMLQGGVGLYRTFVHYDIRGTRSRWNG